MKPILFNTEMVQAILVGRKTQTRRVVKPQFPEYLNREPGRFSKIVPHSPHSFLAEHEEHPNMKTVIQAPFISGDILYVRETFAQPAKHIFWYKADEKPELQNILWHPSIHMPKEAARIFLRVTDVQVERLQEIDDDGIVAEGLEIGCYFDELWDSTIKPADRERYGWAANPWVWVICFERCQEPQGEETRE